MKEGSAISIEERLRDDLRAMSIPSALTPDPGLAGTVLRRSRRRRAGAVAGAAGVALAGILAVVAFGVPLVFPGDPAGPTGPADTGVSTEVPATARPTPGPGAPSPAAVPTFPTPGGGPQAIHVCRVDELRTYLLDVPAGRYREIPFGVVLSPDLRQALVTERDRIGVADRAALLRTGASAVRWIDAPAGSGAAWSPDGRAVLLTSIDKRGEGTTFTAHRYDLASSTVTDTPIKLGSIVGAVGWAADSRRYLVLLPASRGIDTVQPGALQYVDPDGSLGPRVEIQAGAVYGATSYSPSRRLLIADASDLMSVAPLESKIVDTGTGLVVATIPAGARPIGWYDDRTVAWLAPGFPARAVLRLSDVTTGAVGKSVDLATLGPLTGLQLGSSAAFGGPAAALGF